MLLLKSWHRAEVLAQSWSQISTRDCICKDTQTSKSRERVKARYESEGMHTWQWGLPLFIELGGWWRLVACNCLDLPLPWDHARRCLPLIWIWHRSRAFSMWGAFLLCSSSFDGGPHLPAQTRDWAFGQSVTKFFLIMEFLISFGVAKKGLLLSKKRKVFYWHVLLNLELGCSGVK